MCIPVLSHAVITYLTIKIMQEAFKQNSFELTINEYKEKLGLVGKYKDNNTFKTRVIDVVKNEIDKTDIDFKVFELKKVGRSFLKVSFEFDYKNTNKKEKNLRRLRFFLSFSLNTCKGLLKMPDSG